MKKTKGFTLIEMLAVLMIIVIISLLWMRSFSTIQADRAYSESCINVFYSDLSDWVYYASTSRVLSWGVVPDTYIIEANGAWFRLSYTSWSDSSPIVYLDRNLEDYAYCRQKTRFQIRVEYDFSKIVMLPSLISVWNKNWFEMYSWSAKLATGYVNLVLIWKDKAWNITSEQEFWQVLFDARTWMVKKRLCTRYDETDEKKCKEWNTWRW